MTTMNVLLLVSLICFLAMSLCVLLARRHYIIYGMAFIVLTISMLAANFYMLGQPRFPSIWLYGATEDMAVLGLVVPSDEHAMFLITATKSGDPVVYRLPFSARGAQDIQTKIENAKSAHRAMHTSLDKIAKGNFNDLTDDKAHGVSLDHPKPQQPSGIELNSPDPSVGASTSNVP